MKKHFDYIRELFKFRPKGYRKNLPDHLQVLERFERNTRGFSDQIDALTSQEGLKNKHLLELLTSATDRLIDDGNKFCQMELWDMEDPSGFLRRRAFNRLFKLSASLQVDQPTGVCITASIVNYTVTVAGVYLKLAFDYRFSEPYGLTLRNTAEVLLDTEAPNSIHAVHKFWSDAKKLMNKELKRQLETCWRTFEEPLSLQLVRNNTEAKVFNHLLKLSPEERRFFLNNSDYLIRKLRVAT